MYKRLHDTITESQKLGAVSDFAFRLWTNALSKADWYGRLTAEPSKLRIIAFPNRFEKVSEDEIRSALDELADVLGEGLIHLYLDERGDRCMVFHAHEKSNPTGGWGTRVCKGPPPPKGLCTCTKYRPEEEGKRVGGKDFRFFPSVFDQNEKSGPVLPKLCTDQYRDCTDHATDPSPLIYSSLRGGEGGGDPGQGKVGQKGAPEVEIPEAPKASSTDPARLELETFLKPFKFPTETTKNLAIEDLERQGVALTTIVQTLKKNPKGDFVDIVRALKKTVCVKVVVAKPEPRKKTPEEEAGGGGLSKKDLEVVREDPLQVREEAFRAARKKKQELSGPELERLREEARADPAAAALKGVLSDEFVESRVLTIVAERYGIKGL